MLKNGEGFASPARLTLCRSPACAATSQRGSVSRRLPALRFVVPRLAPQPQAQSRPIHGFGASSPRERASAPRGDSQARSRSRSLGVRFASLHRVLSSSSSRNRVPGRRALRWQRGRAHGRVARRDRARRRRARAAAQLDALRRARRERHQREHRRRRRRRRRERAHAGARAELYFLRAAVDVDRHVLPGHVHVAALLRAGREMMRHRWHGTFIRSVSLYLSIPDDGLSDANYNGFGRAIWNGTVTTASHRRTLGCHTTRSSSLRHSCSNTSAPSSRSRGASSRRARFGAARGAAV